MVSWENPPRAHDAYVQTREEVGKELASNPGEWACVARHDRAARAETHVGRIESGREYGQGFEAVYRQIGNEHRVYARKVSK